MNRRGLELLMPRTLGAVFALLCSSISGCEGSEGSGSPSTSDPGEWRCFNIPPPTELCDCVLAAPDEHDAEHRDSSCTLLDCCTLNPASDECVCRTESFASSCENTAGAIGDVVVPTCPPPPGFRVEDAMPEPSAPTCSDGIVTCGEGTPDCRAVAGSCPTCYNCLEPNVSPICAPVSAPFDAVGVPSCHPGPRPADIPAEQAISTCSVASATFSLDGTMSAAMGVGCIDPETNAGVPGALPSCADYEPSIPVCAGFKVLCAAASDAALPVEERADLGPPKCVPR